MKHVTIVLLSVAFLAACQDTQRTGSPVAPPSFDISEARFGGGNPDFFFAPPLAATPQPGDAGFEAGAANALLVPYVRICETDGVESPAGCVTDVTLAVTGSASGLAMTFSPDAEQYHVNWQTTDLNPAKSYRIEVWGTAFETPAEKAGLDGRWLFGWRDIRHAPDVSRCNGSEEFCLINYGQNLPVKVRIEQFVFCPVSRDCAVQFVAAGVSANLEAQLSSGDGASSAQLFIPGQSGTNFAIAFQPCSAEQITALENAIDLPTFGPCVHTVTTFSQRLSVPAIVSLCNALAPIDPSTFDVASPAQRDQIALHHITDDLSRVQALPEAWRCNTSTSGGIASAGSRSRLLELAQAVRDKVLAWVAPRALAASTMVIDEGGGGESDYLNSFFILALPAKFEYELPGDAFQRGTAGESFTLRSKVTDLFGAPVKNARVHWAAISSPGGDATAPGAPTLTSAAGIAEATVQLSAQEGNNVFDAFGRGIADSRETGCSVGGIDAPCNGPRSSFDPFLAIHHHLDGAALPEAPLDIAEGTRLRFTVFGCVRGRGTPAVNGVIGSGEWDCANQQAFPAKLSGGSTVSATLYWMNDNTHLHLAVVVPGTGRENALRIEWDRDGDGIPGGAQQGVRELGDDVWEFVPGNGPLDRFVDEKCVGSGQSSCGPDDAGYGGAMQTVSAFENNLGGQTVYEISHPLSTSDRRCGGSGKGYVCDQLATDLVAQAGQTIGQFLTLRLGSGAQGNTQWPGFLSYLPVTIR